MNNESKEFKIIGTIRHKNNKYLILLGDNYVRYYLKVNEQGNYEYPTLQEYYELRNLYKYKQNITGQATINIKPLIKMKDKIISLTLAASLVFAMSGCANNNDLGNNLDAETITEIEDIITRENSVGVENIDNSQNTTNIDDISNFENVTNYNPTINYMKNFGITLSEGFIDSDNLYAIDELDFDNNKITKYIEPNFCFSYENNCTPGEFSKIMGIENITWNDIENVIINSNILDIEIKQYLLEGVTNLQNNNFNIDLSVLYYNLSNLKAIYYCSAAEMGGKAGTFDHYNHVVRLYSGMPSEVKKSIVIHEMLGHGMTAAYSEQNEGVLCQTYYGYFVIDENKNILDTGNLGHSAMEALADTITCYATNNRLSADETNYTPDMYALNTLCEIAGISVIDYANNGLDYLMSNMKKNGIKDPQAVLIELDTKLESIMLNNIDGIDYSLEELLTDCYIQEIDYLRQNGISNDMIIEIINSQLSNSDATIETIDIDGEGLIGSICGSGAMLINPENMKEVVNQYINSNQKR